MKNTVLLLLFFFACYLIPLGGRPLVSPDEFRYAQIAYEMMEHGNFAAPQMFGHPYFEKPVLGHWLTAANLYLFGCNAFAIRLSSALSTGIAALMIGLLIFSALRDKRLAVLGGVMYLTCGMVFAVGVFCVLDAPVTMFSTGAMLCAFIYLQKDRPLVGRLLMLVLCGVFCGLGFMVKGVPAWVVPALGTAGFLIWQKRWKEFLLMPPIPLLFTALTILPWAIAVHRADGDFWRYFIEVEHIQRFTDSGAGQHPKPWWYLLPFFAGGAFPAALLLLTGIGNAGNIIRSMAKEPLYRFAACSTVLPLILFSCSSGKLATYILPCFAGLAVLMAGFVASALRNYEKSDRNIRILFSVCGWFFAVGGILAVPVGYVFKFGDFENPFFEYVSPMILACGAACAAAGTLLLLSEKQPVRKRLCIMALLFAFPVMTGPFFINWRINQDKMPEETLKKIIKHWRLKPAEIHIVTIPSLMHAAAWSFRTRDIQLVNAIGEMKYGDARARRENRRPMMINSNEFSALLRRRDRKSVVYIHWSDRPVVKVRGVRHAGEFVDDNIAARYYPVKRKLPGKD